MDLVSFVAAVEPYMASIGVASTIALALRAGLPKLRAYADKTAWKADDDAVERFSIVLDTVVALLDIAHQVFAAAALNPSPKQKDTDK